ncbi:bacteriophage abortive infection AbiH family protein [Paenibacillus glucanolyticus]
MSSLFIIGNGFDLAHGMKTSYEDFRQYLKGNYPDASFKGYVPEGKMMPNGGMSYNDIDTIGFLMEVISNAEPDGEQWSDLETSIGFLDLDEYLDDWSDDDEDDNDWHKVYRNQDVASNLAGAILEITDYFSDWIGTIEIGECYSKNDIAQLIDGEQDFFLTFNYTETLELLYKAKNVCHIHGKQGGKLLFGHGNDTDYTDKYMDQYIGSEDHLQDMQRRLRKDTTGAINRNRIFFNSITMTVDKIYSYGFSFSKVDEVYIKEICQKLTTDNVTWFLNDFDDEIKREQYIETIQSCGFRGEFDTYHIT